MASFSPQPVDVDDQGIYNLFEMLQLGSALWRVVECPDTNVNIIVCRNSPEVRRLLQPAVLSSSPIRTPLPGMAVPAASHIHRSPLPRSASRPSASSDHHLTPEALEDRLRAVEDRQSVIESSPSHSAPPSDQSNVVHIAITPVKLKKSPPVNHTLKNLRKVESGRIRKASARSTRLPRSASVVHDSDDDSDTVSIGGSSRDLSPLPTVGERLLGPEHDRWFQAQQWQATSKAQLRACEDGNWTAPARQKFRERLYNYAHEVANVAVARQWRHLLHLWRQDQLNLRPNSAGKMTYTPEQPFTPLELQFLHLYRTTTTERGRAVWLAITDKIRQAKLYVAFEKIVASESPVHLETTAVTVYHVESQRTRLADLYHERTDIRDRCRAHLFYLLHPEIQRHYRQTHGYPSKIAEKGPRDEWRHFTRRLRIAERWHTIQETLTIGGISLMSESLMHWLDREDGGENGGCKPREFKLWLACLQRFNPRAYEQCQNWGYTVQRAVESGRLTDGLHQLEVLTNEEFEKLEDVSKVFDALPLTDIAEVRSAPPSSQPERVSRDVQSIMTANAFLDNHIFPTGQPIAPSMLPYDGSSDFAAVLPMLPPLQAGQDSFPVDYYSGQLPSSSFSEDYTMS